jgi:hypothetical protein
VVDTPPLALGVAAQKEFQFLIGKLLTITTKQATATTA